VYATGFSRIFKRRGSHRFEWIIHRTDCNAMAYQKHTSFLSLLPCTKVCIVPWVSYSHCNIHTIIFLWLAYMIWSTYKLAPCDHPLCPSTSLHLPPPHVFHYSMMSSTLLTRLVSQQWMGFQIMPSAPSMVLISTMKEAQEKQTLSSASWDKMWIVSSYAWCTYAKD